jgi:hypothetical protein
MNGQIVIWETENPSLILDNWWNLALSFVMSCDMS